MMNGPHIDPRTGQPKRPNSPWMVILIVVGACGVVSLALVAVLAAVLFPVFANAREAARKASCLSNTRMMNTALLMYAMDYDERYPQGKVWQNSIAKYVPPEATDFCPTRPAVVPGYAFSARMSGAVFTEIAEPALEPAIFESNLGKRNSSDLLQSFVMPHSDRGIVGFVDGSARAVELRPAVSPRKRSPEPKE